MSVRPVRDGDVGPLAVALARAFQDDPVTCWVYASERKRPHWSTRFFAWQLRRLMVQDVSWTTEDGAGGAALWALPGRWREDAGDTIKLLRLTLLGVLPRLPRVLRGLGQVELRHPSERHMYLAVLGVDPDRQGQGVGSQLIRPGLDLCDRGACRPTWRPARRPTSPSTAATASRCSTGSTSRRARRSGSSGASPPDGRVAVRHPVRGGSGCVGIESGAPGDPRRRVAETARPAP